MSGLEVAGVVLGALPLVLSELEHYANGVASFKRYRRYRIHLQSMIDAVKTQKVIFEDTLEQLVTGIVRIEEMANFIADPGSRSVMIEPSLKKRLAGSYDVYFANVDGMCTALAVIMNKLALGADGKVCQHSKSFIVCINCANQKEAPIHGPWYLQRRVSTAQV